MPKILIIDDEPDVLEFQSAYLLKRNYEVTTAKDSLEALAALSQTLFDVVFCDIRLEQDTSGLSILKRAKELYPQLIIYLVTGLVDTQIIAQGLQLGAREVLGKPLPNQAMEQKIKEALGL